jgi:hypothetical protein
MVRQAPPEGSSDRVPASKRQGSQAQPPFAVSAPKIELPKGGGAIRGIGEKFAADPVTGTGSMSVPITTSPGRGGFSPRLALNCDSGSGNGPFGLGWNLALASISRKTDKGLPRYRDEVESDVFLLAGTEDLVPVLDAAGRLPAPAETRAYGADYKSFHIFRLKNSAIWTREF